MSPKDRDLITTSVANLWNFQTLMLANLLQAMREEGFSEARIESLLRGMDRDVDALAGESEQNLATGAIATVRKMLADRPM